MVTNLPKVDEIKSPNIYQGKFLTLFQRQLLQKSLEKDLPELSHQRIQIMLLADEGKTQTQIRKELGCCPATARHWIHIARSGMAHQWNSSPIGRPKIVNEEYLERLQQLINHSPREFGYSFEKWTAGWLSKHLAKELEIKVSDASIKRLLKQMGLSTRPKSTITRQKTTQPTEERQIYIRDLSTEIMANERKKLAVNFLTLATNQK
ncbi:MAG: helix-turn-helix domain-containing protein [Dolichospermum sp. OL03]|jgi:transposase|nr:helix-turn-helix domain-containing protein [Dolichospermum sp. OL01]MCO5799811.1 helix-turn-helix domain-containing protein [Dolichospermum sp. OL03]MCS6280742.1 helix-turn-helix domain-containing protein [Dolichospermum sp.]MDK2408002.1 helix-turn-helix domain-containing protein [Aphanizomenon sp. 202]MDK2458489.1 helix-turn-helix domain-containing protein [Aphanizomenon sp. PH219]